MRTFFAFIAGILFGAGLIISGMSDPGNVIGFLDVSGQWNPALAFVMGGAILVAAPVFAWMRRRQRSLLGDVVQLPARTPVTVRLLCGSAVFGAGWGLAGLCPGPALVLAAGASSYILIFIAAMMCGLWVAVPLAGAARSDVDEFCEL